MDDLVAWLREQLDAVQSELDSAISELEGWTDTGYRSADEILRSWPRAEIDAKRARIDMLAVLVHEPRPLSYTAAALLQIEAQALADRPGFRDEWRLT